ncbi:MAG: hypothetical protein N2738_03470 [Thermodesulfovibrionales bacterium]|nr:hypothetical protein [Thermodesulfovibrionales bacterium]
MNKYFFEYNGELYPSKYVISLANKYANAKELHPQEFSGGAETNNFLKYLGFKIVKIVRSISKPSEEINKMRINHNQ